MTPPQVTTRQLYNIKAVHVAEKLRLKDLRDRFSRSPMDFSNYEIVLKYSEDSYAFIYKYGSVVFFNVPDDLQERELSAIQEYRAPSALPRASDVFLLEVLDPMQAQETGIQTNRAYFDRVVVSGLTYQSIRLACLLLAESTALDYYEAVVENLLEQTNAYSKKLRQLGTLIKDSEDFIRFIGMCLDIKQEIISNLYIVDSPDETWEVAELDRLHQDFKLLLEVDARYRAMDYKIRIIQESLEVLVDLSHAKRATRLDIIIIVLIAIEIVLSLLQWGRH